jgi:hypothetical protein
MNTAAANISPQMTSVQAPFTYVADGCATVHNCDFVRDPKFAESYRQGIATISHQRPDLHVEWRTYTACWAVAHGMKLEGDLVECGVNTGIYSKAAMVYVDFEKHQDRLFWLLDTYQGVPETQMSASEIAQGKPRSNAKYPDCYEAVKQTFSSYPNARVVRGMVPDTLSQVTSEKIAYLSIDMNIVHPEIAAANFFWDKLVRGAVVLIDDYGFAAHYDQKLAFDAFAKVKSVPILPLPTGQAIIIKP